MVDQNVVIKFKGDSTGLGQASGEAVRSLDSVINLASDAGGAIAAFFDSTVNEFAEFERRLNRTDQLFLATEGAARVTTTEINNFADALGDAALTSQEEVLRASNALQTFRAVSGDTFFRTLTAAQDLSEVLGSDLQGATIQLAKALEDPVLGLTALRRSGVSFTEEQREMVKSLVETGDLLEAQNIILQQVEGQLGGAGVAAAQGFAGAVDTLGENLNDFNRTAGETAATVFTPLVNGAATVLEVFNSLPVGIQKALFGVTGFVGVLATATAAVVAFQVANKQLEIVQSALILKTDALNAATALHAVAVGTADAAQKQLAASMATTALVAANVAAALASIALVVNEFNSVTKAARDVETAVDNVGASLLALEEANARASGDPAQIAQTTEAIIEANKRQIEESLGAVTRFLDQVRTGINEVNQFLGETVGRVNPVARALSGVQLSTALETSLDRQQVQFGVLTDQINQALRAYESFDAETATAEEFNAQLGLIEASIRDLEGQRNINPVISDQLLENLREAQQELNAFSAANDNVAETVEEALERVQAASESATDAIDISLANQTEIVRQSQLDGVLTAEQAQERITQLQIQGGRDRIVAVETELARIKELRMGEDTEELATRERELTKELGDLQLSLVEQQIDAQQELQSREEQRVEEIKKAQLEASEEAKQAQLDAVEEAARARIQAEEQIANSLRIQNDLLSSRRSLQGAIASLQQTEFSIAAQLTDDAEQKAEIEEQAARARLAGLERAQQVERQIFELGVRRQQTELQIEAIRLRAALETARLNGASDTEIQGIRLQQDALGQQAQILALTTELERNTLAIQQREQRTQARADVVQADVATDTARLEERRTEQNGDRIDRQIQELRESAFEGLRNELLRSAQAPQPQSLIQPFNRQPSAPRQVAAPGKQTQFGDVVINQNNNVDVRGNSPGAVQEDFERVALDTVDKVATKLQELVQ